MKLPRSILIHPDRTAIIRRSTHFKRVLMARGLPERLASLRAVQYREFMWRQKGGDNVRLW